MTDKKTEALKLAISRLEWFIDSYPHDITISKDEFLQPFKEALAEQPAQQDIPKIGCVNHDCDKCKAQQQEKNI